MPALASPGQRLAVTLRDSLRAYRLGPTIRDRERRVIWGGTPPGELLDGMTGDGFVAQASSVFLGSERIYRFGNTTCFEIREAEEPRLVLLGTQHRAEPHAANVLANLVGIGVQGEEGVTQSLLPPKLINAVLAD